MTDSDPILALRVAQECVANASDLVKEAATLGRRGSQGRALALAVLAEEECSKAFLWMLKAMGEDIPESVLRSHRVKQRIGSGYSIAAVLFLGMVDEAVATARKQQNVEESLRKVDEVVSAMIQQAQANPEVLVARLQPIAQDLLPERQESKERGLYVGVGADGTVASPRSTTREEARTSIERAHRFQQYLARFLAPGVMTPEMLAIFREHWLSLPAGVRKFASARVSDMRSTARGRQRREGR